MPLPCHRLKLGETLTKSRPSTGQFDPLFSPIRPHLHPLCVKSRTTAVQAAHPSPRLRTAFGRLLKNSFVGLRPYFERTSQTPHLADSFARYASAPLVSSAPLRPPSPGSSHLPPGQP